MPRGCGSGSTWPTPRRRSRRSTSSWPATRCRADRGPPGSATGSPTAGPSALTDLWTRLGRPRDEASELARVNLAAVRGLLFDLALTGDRAAADAGMRLLGERFGLTATPSPVEVYPMR